MIGGTSLLGGIGTIFGGIIGAALIRVIDNGAGALQVDANWFKMAIGFSTIFAVVVNAWMRKRARAIKVETPTWRRRSSKSAICRNGIQAFTRCKNVSLDIYPNEALGLVGDNGAGKSTLINIPIRYTETGWRRDQA